MNADKLIIYHNPGCRKSREALLILQQNKKAPEIVEYLENARDKTKLRKLSKMPGISIRDLIRNSEQACSDIGLGGSATDEQIIEAISRYPILL